MNPALSILLNPTLLHIHEHASLHGEEGSFSHRLLSVFSDVILNTLEITILVISMMAVIELINVSSSGKLIKRLNNRPFIQLLLACLLGIIPGCAGGFAVVSMFTHNAISFGALAGGMIATFGDEAFFLFAKNPMWAMILTGILFSIGLITGLILNVLSKKWHLPIENHEFEVHEEVVSHNHEKPSIASVKTGQKIKILVTHFVKDHLWEHVIKKHLLSIFLWSFGVLLFLGIVSLFVDVTSFIETYAWAKYLLLLLAVLVGFIPESGPNLIFVIMFLEGTLPFGILLANSISQNGHAGLPLLAQSRKNFFVLKTLTMLLGFVCGAMALIWF